MTSFFNLHATFHPNALSNDLMIEEDRALVSRVLQGDMQAFRLLIKQHEKLVAHMIGRLVKHDGEREEICQDVFLRVYDKLKDFSFQSRLSTWIATIAYRLAINHLRKKKLYFSDIPEDEAFTKNFIEEDNPETIVADQDMNTFVLQLMDNLPVQYKTVLTLYHVESMNYREIGEVTNMPEGTVKNYLFRARKLLKDKIMLNLGKEELL
jgi:RNA polymerase sigma-70 factor, ECF subfamily